VQHVHVDDLHRALGSLPIGTPVTLTLLRRTNLLKLDVTPIEPSAG